jgi:hypothetical protein
MTVGSDHDYRNPALLYFYAARADSRKTVVYIPLGHWTSSDPMWALSHSFDGDPHPPAGLTGANGRLYTLQAHFPYAGASGWHWFAYRLEDRGH